MKIRRVPVLFLDGEATRVRLKNRSKIARKTLNAAKIGACADYSGESKVNGLQRNLLTVPFGADRAWLDAGTDQRFARDGHKLI